MSLLRSWNESDKKEEGDRGGDHRTGRGNVNSSNLPEKLMIKRLQARLRVLIHDAWRDEGDILLFI